ncbi:protein of unknown function [Streptococcus thermophilus]|nr:protein of unknown function [Streptococcus thermophilus]
MVLQSLKQLMLIIILFKMGDLFFSIVSQYSVATYQLAAENGMTIWSRLVLGGTVESLSSWSMYMGC